MRRTVPQGKAAHEHLCGRCTSCKHEIRVIVDNVNYRALEDGGEFEVDASGTYAEAIVPSQR